MAQNLNYITTYSFCYNDNPYACEFLGRLYPWQKALAACPSGWHLPTENEWFELINYLGGISVAGGKLKTSGLVSAYSGSCTYPGWEDPNTGATNETGFSALGAGQFDGINFGQRMLLGVFWTATEENSTRAKVFTLWFNSNEATTGLYPKGQCISVRCVKDE
jgi:uncharacterized protein (TIGR02145 family)